MSTDSNSLAREFLTDVNRLCNAVVQRAEAREEEDEEEEETHMAALGQYLVHGRGFLLLTKLDSIIDQVTLSYQGIFYQYIIVNFRHIISGLHNFWEPLR